MLSIPSAILGNDSNIIGVWTPVSDGVSPRRAQEVARSVMREHQLLSEDHVPVAAGFLAAALAIGRATPGGSLAGFMAQVPACGSQSAQAQLGHWQSHVDTLLSLASRSGSRTSQESLEEAAEDLNNVCTLMRSLDADEQASIFEEMNYAIIDLFAENYPESYAQPWDAPDTLELVLVRRDRL